MGYWRFDGVDDYAVGTGTLQVTAAPFFLVACCRPVGAGSFSSLISIADSSSTSGFAVLRLQSLAPAVALSSPVISAIGQATLRQGGAWHILVGCHYAASHLRIFCGQVGTELVQCTESSAAATVLGAVNEFSIGRRGGSSPSNYSEDDIAWAGCGVGVPTLPEIRELIRTAAPLDVLRGRLRHFWPLGGASTEPDILGGINLTVSGAVYTAGGDALGQAPLPTPAPLLARALKALQARVSVGSTWYEVRVPVALGQRHVGVVQLDQAGNLVSVEVDGTDIASEATSGTHNAQTGDVYVGAELVAATPQSATEEAAIGVAAGWRSAAGGVLSGTDLVEARKAAAAWLAPEPIDNIERQVAVSGTTALDLASACEDPSGHGLQILAAAMIGDDDAVTVTGATTIDVTPSGLAIGDFVTIEVTWTTLAPAAIAATAKQLIDVQIVAGGYSNGYRYRRRCLIPADRVSGSGDLTGYVARFDETADWLKPVEDGGELVLEGDAVDVRFETEAGVKLEHSIALHDPATGRLVADIRFPTLSGASANRWWCYTGKSLEDAEEDAAALADYLLVSNPADGTDRTGRGRNLTVSGITEAELLGPAGALAGAGVATIDDVTWLDGLSALTVRVISRRAAAGTGRGELIQGTVKSSTAGVLLSDVASGYRGGQPNVVLWIVNTSAGIARLESSGNAHALATQIKHGTWASGVLPKLYVDGVADVPSWVGKVVSGTATANATLAGTTDTVDAPLRVGSSDVSLAIGGWSDRLGEVWIRAEALSADHIATEATNLADPGAFIGIGGRETPADVTSAPVAAPLRLAATAGVNDDNDVAALAYDPDGTVTLTAVGTPSHGAASIVGGQLRYKATAGYAGTDRFTYTVSDGTGSSTGVVVFDVAAAAAVSGDDAKHLGDLYEGCAEWCINLTNVKIGSASSWLALGRKIPRAGDLKAVILEIAANKVGSTETKSGGDGPMAFDYQICHGKAPVSGDSSNVPSRPGTLIASGSRVHGRTAQAVTSWTQDATGSVLWTVIVGIPSAARSPLNLQENGATLPQQTTKAAATAAAGSFYAEAVTSGGQNVVKIYLHATGSGNPNTNGRTYRWPAEVRRLHRLELPDTEAIDKDDYIFIKTRKNSLFSASTHWLSLNGPSMKTSDGAGGDVQAYAPFGMTPPRRQSPYHGDHANLLLSERATADTWLRRGEFVHQVTLVYDLGDGQELLLGDGYREGQGELRTQAKVHSGRRLRMRWRRTGGNLIVRDVWVFAHWATAAGIPTDDLTVTLTEESGSWGAGYTDSCDIAASSNTVGGDQTTTTIKAWSASEDGTWPGWSKGTLGSNRTLTEGRIYSLEFTSSTSEAKAYVLHPILDGRELGPFDDESHASVNMWTEDPAVAGAMAFAQYSTDGGTTWKGLRMSYDAATAQRRDIALPALLAKV